MRALTMLRLPLLLAGVALLFLADRYFGAESYNLGLRIASLILVGVSVALTAAASASAAGQGYAAEAKSWRYALLWQLSVLLGLGLYLVYRKVLGDTAAPETFGTKALLAAWLLLCELGLFAGIGFEWAMKDAGRGPNAEPPRVARAGLSWLAVGMLLAFLVTLNYTADKKDVTRDWSYLKIRTPSPASLAQLKTLTEDMTVALFYPQGNEVRTMVADYFQALAAADPHVKLQYYDKDMAPTQAEQYKVSRNGQIVFDVKGKKSRIDTGLTLAKAKKTLKELDGEFQKAFLEITSDRKTLYFTRGHGEMSWVGEAGDSPTRSLRLLEGFLRQQNYSTRLFGVAEGSATAVPDDAAAVVIVGPTEPFGAEEVAALKAYVEGGGNLMVFLDVDGPTGNIMDEKQEQPLYELLAGMGLKYNRVPIANEKQHVAMTRGDSDNWFIYSNIFTSHESVVSLARNDERAAILVYQTGYFQVTPELGKWKAFETVRTLSDSFADKNRNFKFDPDEKRDSYVLGAVAELKEKKADAPGGKKNPKQGRVVAFADSTVIADGIVRQPANAVYFADSLKWLVGESETAGEIATEEDVKIRHTSKEDAIWFHSTVVVVPLLVLGAGFVATRRKKAGKDKGAGNAA